MLGVIFYRSARLLQFFLFLLIWPYTKVVSLTTRKKKIPPITNPLLLYSAADLADLIRRRKVSCSEVVTAYIDRIKEVDPIINSVVEDRFVEALEEAKGVDRLLEEQPDLVDLQTRKPLLGVPISFKETVPVKGMSNNGGRLKPERRLAEADSEAVRCLREAGAIPLVVTNTPELCMFWETYNMANGRTNNPYDVTRTAGGSSGGECALMSCAGSLIGLGSDIAGSGRLPAMFCGVSGHKPTPQLVSVANHMPDSEDRDWNKFLTLSPIARYARDLPLVLANAAPKDVIAPLNLDQQVDLRKLKVFYIEDNRGHLPHSTSSDVRGAIRKAAMHFNKFGIEPQKVRLDYLDSSLEATVLLMLNMKSPQTIFQHSQDTEDWTIWDVLKELLKKHLFCSKVMAYSVYFGLLKKVAEAAPKRRVEKMKELRDKMERSLGELLGNDGVLILPVFPTAAPKHYTMYYKFLNTTYVSLFNLLGFPATACPIAFDSRGLPIGVQIVANKFQDRVSLGVACELEREFGGWVPPSIHDTPNKLMNNNESILPLMRVSVEEEDTKICKT